MTHVSTSKCKPFGHRHGIWIFRYSSGERSSHDNGAGDTEVLGSPSHLCFEIAEVPAARALSEHFPRDTTGFPYCVVLDVFAPQPMKQAHVLAYRTRDTRAFVCVRISLAPVTPALPITLPMFRTTVGICSHRVFVFIHCWLHHSPHSTQCSVLRLDDACNSVGSREPSIFS